jgi:hypothetical protein
MSAASTGSASSPSSSSAGAARGSGSAPLTIFAIPKAFRGHIAVIQRNAIASWTRMNPRPDVLLFGTDEGTAQVAAELGVRHIPTVQKNQWGTPLVGDLFAQAQGLARSPWLCYVNADIILFDDFIAAVSRTAAWTKSFLMVGRRTDVDITEPLGFQQLDWAGQLKESARSKGRLQAARSIDYFAFSRGLYPAMPPLAIGRFWWDNWLLWKARSLGARVLDATAVVTAIHQNHDYSHTTYGREAEMMASEEAILNCRLTCEQNPADFDEGLSWRYIYTIDDAPYKLTPQKVTGNPRHLWKSFKRYTSRPLGVAKLVRRALFGPRSMPSAAQLREASDSKRDHGTS